MGIGVGGVLGLVLLAACSGARRVEAREEPAPRAPVLAAADDATRSAVDFWSRAHIAPRAEVARRTARAPRASTEGAGSGAPEPTEPPRSASEAAERRTPPATTRAPSAPEPVAPTAPAETRDPFRR